MNDQQSNDEQICGFSHKLHECAEKLIDRDILKCASSLVGDRLTAHYELGISAVLAQLNYDNIENFIITPRGN